MSPITDEQLDRYKYILMYDDERVMDAILALRDAAGQDWWYLVVDLEAGGYAACTFAALAAGLDAEGGAYLERSLGDLVGTTLARIEVVVEQAEADEDEVTHRTAASACAVAAITHAGELRGVLPVGTVRSAMRGLFDGGLAQMAGKYADLPEKGLLSRRRASAGKKKRPPSGESQPPSPSN